MRAFTAVAEQPDDPFRFIAIQTLAEISMQHSSIQFLRLTWLNTVLIDVQCVANAGGMRILLQTFSEGAPALASLLNPVFLYILDSPSTRKHLRPGKDLEVWPN
jgi:rapamycin-insensitive companion of mTOR